MQKIKLHCNFFFLYNSEVESWETKIADLKKDKRQHEKMCW